MVPIVEAVLSEIKNESIKNRLEKNDDEDSKADEVWQETLTCVILNAFRL